MCIDAFPSCPSFPLVKKCFVFFFFSSDQLKCCRCFSLMQCSCCFLFLCCCRLLCAMLRACRVPSMCFCCCFSCLRRVFFCGVFLEFRTILLDEGECSNCGSGDLLSHCASCALSLSVFPYRVVFRVASLTTRKSGMCSHRPVIALQIDSVVCLGISTVSSASFVDQHIA